MDYDQARVYLTTALTYGINMGLHRIKRLLELLGQPQKGLRCIHIAGTTAKVQFPVFCVDPGGWRPPCRCLYLAVSGAADRADSYYRRS